MILLFFVKLSYMETTDADILKLLYKLNFGPKKDLDFLQLNLFTCFKIELINRMSIFLIFAGSWMFFSLNPSAPLKI